MNSLFISPTQALPELTDTPQHVAIIMDGNGRWAKKRLLPRIAGHSRGLEAVRKMVAACLTRDIPFLTLFAFSSENWRRPPDEVGLLMRLFVGALENEVNKLHENGVRLKVIGDLTRFDARIQALIAAAEQKTADNRRLILTIAANYGGRWDIIQAMNQLAMAEPEKAGTWNEDDLIPFLSMHYAPEPDLFIRTGGEERISNFLLWQLAYTEFYFTKTLWPAFDHKELDKAIASFRLRERRFGRTSEQLHAQLESQNPP